MVLAPDTPVDQSGASCSTRDVSTPSSDAGLLPSRECRQTLSAPQRSAVNFVRWFVSDFGSARGGYRNARESAKPVGSRWKLDGTSLEPGRAGVAILGEELPVA